MTELQETFLTELKSNPKFTAAQYAELYNKHRKIAIEEEAKTTDNEFQSKSMGNYYTVAILSNFINNENKFSRIIAIAESRIKS